MASSVRVVASSVGGLVFGVGCGVSGPRFCPGGVGAGRLVSCTVVLCSVVCSGGCVAGGLDGGVAGACWAGVVLVIVSCWGVALVGAVGVLGAGVLLACGGPVRLWGCVVRVFGVVERVGECWPGGFVNGGGGDACSG